MIAATARGFDKREDEPGQIGAMKVNALFVHKDMTEGGLPNHRCKASFHCRGSRLTESRPIRDGGAPIPKRMKRTRSLMSPVSE